LLVMNPLGKERGFAGLDYAGRGFAPGAGLCAAPVAAGARLVTDAGTGAR
jgi:hypothetical protein